MEAIKRFIGKVKNLLSKREKEVAQSNIFMTVEPEIYNTPRVLGVPKKEVPRGMNDVNRDKVNLKHRNRMRNKQARISRRINRAA